MDFIYKHFNDGFVVILAGLGVTIAPNVFLGGLFWAIGGAMILREYSPALRQTPRKLTIITASFLAVLAAIGLHQYYPSFPISLGMAGFGILAVPLVKRFAARQTEIADAVIDKISSKKLK